MADLLKCPFCGGEALKDNSLRDGCNDGEPDARAYWITCRFCAATGGWAKSEGGAARCWNMRQEVKG